MLAIPSKLIWQLASLALKYGLLPLVAACLRKVGSINAVEEHAAIAVQKINDTVGKIQVTAEYPNPKKPPSAQGWREAGR